MIDVVVEVGRGKMTCRLPASKCILPLYLLVIVRVPEPCKGQITVSYRRSNLAVGCCTYVLLIIYIFRKHPSLGIRPRFC